MDESKILRLAGVTNEWLHEFVVESNRIDPQPEETGIGSPLYEYHRDALMYSLWMATEGRFALPNEVHKLLLRDHPLVLAPRSKKETDLLPIAHMAYFMWRWNRQVYRMVNAFRADTDTPDDVRWQSVWDKHVELMQIRPYEHCSGKVGRILLVNHCLLIGVEPWIIKGGNSRDDYILNLKRHYSADWAHNPPRHDLALSILSAISEGQGEHINLPARKTYQGPYPDSAVWVERLVTNLTQKR